MNRCLLIPIVINVGLICGCPGVIPNGNSGDFRLRVVPESIADTIPGQLCVILVTIEEDQSDAVSEPVVVTAEGEGVVFSVDHREIAQGEVAEVSVTMLPAEDEDAGAGDALETCNVTIHGVRGTMAREVTVPITLTSNEEDLLGEQAAAMRDRFIPWLAENRPDLGIDESTVWEGTIVKPHWLVVSHYLYFNEEWEMHVFWHVMIPPYDWARIELRRRYEETTPSLAFEIPSVSAPDPIVVNEIEPEGTLWR